jgi:hypothetical protein
MYEYFEQHTRQPCDEADQYTGKYQELASG